MIKIIDVSYRYHVIYLYAYMSAFSDYSRFYSLEDTDYMCCIIIYLHLIWKTTPTVLKFTKITKNCSAVEDFDYNVCNYIFILTAKVCEEITKIVRVNKWFWCLATAVKRFNSAPIVSAKPLHTSLHWLINHSQQHPSWEYFSGNTHRATEACGFPRDSLVSLRSYHCHYMKYIHPEIFNSIL